MADLGYPWFYPGPAARRKTASDDRLNKLP